VQEPHDEKMPLTKLLQLASAGDSTASGKVDTLVYAEMRKIAAAQMRRERHQVTFQATALAHEAYMRLLGVTTLSKDDKRVWLGAFTRACKNVLIDASRRRNAGKRGKDPRKVELDSQAFLDHRAHQCVDIIDLHGALSQLEKKFPRAAQVANLHLFAGMTMPEISAALDVSLRTAETDWQLAKAVIHRALSK
jgi:RNA polymerase sigma factor (TIGR02999 family)